MDMHSEFFINNIFYETFSICINLLGTHCIILKARETGICPVRRELYTQCFDEIIRQVTINCAERGLLLLRIRDEMRMTIDAYQALYCSSIAFGMRKALHAEQVSCLYKNFLYSNLSLKKVWILKDFF